MNAREKFKRNLRELIEELEYSEDDPEFDVYEVWGKVDELFPHVEDFHIIEGLDGVHRAWLHANRTNIAGTREEVEQAIQRRVYFRDR